MEQEVLQLLWPDSNFSEDAEVWKLAALDSPPDCRRVDARHSRGFE